MMLIRRQCTEFFSCTMLSGASWVFTCAMLSQEYYDNTEQIFHVQCCLEALGQHCTKFLSVAMQCCPKSIRTILNTIFSVQCCLEPLGQHCTRFLPVPCCSKSVKATLDRIYNFSLN